MPLAVDDLVELITADGSADVPVWWQGRPGSVPAGVPARVVSGPHGFGRRVRWTVEVRDGWRMLSVSVDPQYMRRLEPAAAAGPPLAGRLSRREVPR